MLQFIEYSQILIGYMFEKRPPIPLGTWILCGLVPIAFAVFLWALWPKLRVLMRSAGENRLDRPAQRLWNTLRIAFAQSKMFKDGRAGWMHAFIFWGFLVLLFRAFEFFLIGFWPIFEGPYSVNFRLLDMEGGLALDVISVIYAIYFYAKDVFILLVILACLYALYRRLVVKPKRLNLSNEGIIILLLILTIMVSDVVFEGAKISPSTGGWGNPLTLGTLGGRVLSS